jgi:DNA-binding NarL/FixJ family response regulator
LTTYDDDEYIYEALKNGADGFLLKGTTKSDLVRAIETVFNHGVSVDPDIARKVFAMFGKMVKTMPSQPGSLDESNIEDLTINEIRIIQLIGRGLSNKEITSELNFSEGTVRNYISTILKKLDLRDRTQIAIFALQSSLMLKDTGDNDK